MSSAYRTIGWNANKRRYDLVAVSLAVGCLMLFAAIQAVVNPALTIDEGLRASPVGVRVLLAPGMILLWPIFLRRWIAGTPAPAEQNAHRLAARRTPGARP